MKKIIIMIILSLVMINSNVNAGEKEMKVKLSIDNQDVIIRLEDNSASAQLVQMLPAEFDFTDFAGEEKITNFPRPISLEGAPRGMIATAGKLFIYAPWKNMGIFYKTHSLVPDKNLIELGEVEQGLNIIAEQKNKFTAYMEIIK